MAGVISRERAADTVHRGESADENIGAGPRVAHHVRNAGVVWVDVVPGRCQLTDIAHFRQYRLIGPSADVWNRVDGFRSDDDIVRDVLAAYPDHPETASAQCFALLDEFTQLGLLLLQLRREP